MLKGNVQNKIESDMNTQVRKAYNSPFTLSEAQLRKILGTVEEQLLKADSTGRIAISATITCADGSTTSEQDGSRVLFHDNFGQRAIVDLRVEGKCFSSDPKVTSNIPTHLISIRLSDLTRSLLNPPSAISIVVESDSKDWASSASAELEQKIHPTFRSSLKRWMADIHWSFYLILGWFLYLSVNPVYKAIPSAKFPEQPPKIQAPDKLHVYNQFKLEVESGKVKTPIEGMLRLEEIRANAPRSPFETDEFKSYKKRRDEWVQRQIKITEFMFGVLYLSITLGSIVIISKIVSFAYPPYLFDWGDGSLLTARRQKAANFYLVAIVLALMISIAATFLTDFMKGVSFIAA
jgi:hypothetical protein